MRLCESCAGSYLENWIVGDFLNDGSDDIIQEFDDVDYGLYMSIDGRSLGTFRVE